MSLTIKKGGVIIREKHNEAPKDVTDEALFHLMENVKLDENVTLRDIFLILQRDMGVYTCIINNWVDDIVEEGLSGKKSEPTEDDYEIDFLELYWNMTAEIGKDPEFDGFTFPEFHGWGTWPESSFNNQPEEYKGGIGVEFTPSYDLIDLPLKLRDNAQLNVNKDYYHDKEPKIYKNPEYSLLHILYAIIWELSFFGCPKIRCEKSKHIFDVSEQIKNGTIEKFPI